MAPNLKRNKTPIVLSCIYFHWKQPFSCTVLSPSGIFRMIPYLLIHKIYGDGLPQISGLLGPAVSLSEQTMYWPYPAFTTSLHPSFCMFWERDKIKLDSPWGAHWFHLPASGRAQCLNLLWNVCQLFCWREISVLLGGEQIVQVARDH